MVERVDQVIGKIMRTLELENKYMDEDNPWKGKMHMKFAV